MNQKVLLYGISLCSLLFVSCKGTDIIYDKGFKQVPRTEMTIIQGNLIPKKKAQKRIPAFCKFSIIPINVGAVILFIPMFEGSESFTKMVQ